MRRLVMWHLDLINVLEAEIFSTALLCPYAGVLENLSSVNFWRYNMCSYEGAHLSLGVHVEKSRLMLRFSACLKPIIWLIMHMRAACKC